MGREQALKALDDAFQRSCLVELVGPPGVGKTRLSLELARRGATPSALRFCDLTEATSLEAFHLRAARALDVEVPLHASHEEIGRRLRERLWAEDPSTLVVLDNFESLPASVTPWLAAWFTRATPRVLVTTRRRLIDVPAVSVALRPLSVEREPGARWSEAAELLTVRAQAATGGAFEAEHERETLEQLARGLDGLPLALELAAARFRVLAPPQVLERLSERFRILRSVDGDLSRAGLRESIAASFVMLSPDEQRALLALSVFRGGFTLPAAEAVLAPAVAEWPLDLLESLLDHSVLTVDEDPHERRYGLLLCIREFAAEEAAFRGEGLEEAMASHAAHHVSLGERLCARADLDARRGLLRERDNLLAVVDRAAKLAPGVGLRAALVLASPACGLPYAAVDHLLTTALDVADASVAATISPAPPAPPAPPAATGRSPRGRALLQRGTVRRHLGRLDEAALDLHAAVVLAEAGADRALLAEALAGLGNTAAVTADWKTVRGYLERALDAHPEPRFRGLGLTMLANSFCNEDDHERAEALYREAIVEASRHGDEATAAVARLALGVLLLEVGELDEAHACLDDALSAHRRAGARHWEGIALAYLARWKQEKGDLAGALDLYPRSLQCLEMVGVQRAEAVASYHFATALLEAGEIGAAAERLRAVLPLVRATCRDHEGLILAAQGVVAARRGAAADAELLYRRAATALAAYSRPTFLAAVHVLQGAAPAPEHAACADVCLALRVRVQLPCAPATPPLLIARDGSWFHAPGAPASIPLGRRRTIRGVLAALARARHEHPGDAVHLGALIEAGWPGERIVAGAGEERVYAAIATLRRLGLRGLLLQNGDGYLLSPELPLVRR